MEIIEKEELQLKREETIQKLKDYINSLVSKKIKKSTKKISDDTSEKIIDIFEQDEHDFEEESKNDLQQEQQEEEQREQPNETQQDNLTEEEQKQDFDIPNEDQDEYIPRDSEFWEAMWEQSRFAEIYPPFLWYYVQWKKSYFNRETNLRSKKKKLSHFSHKLPEWTKTYTYTWVLTSGINAIPLPDGAWPDTASLCCQWWPIPEFQVDQNGCIYLVSTRKQFVSFNFGLNQHDNKTSPIKEDHDKIIFDSLTTDTKQLLNKLKTSWRSAQQKALAIKHHIISNKKYSTKVQWTLRNKSNRDNYIKHLDESPILECFSANSLCVALCRELWIPARLVVWHMIQSTNKEWKACITKNDWHAWSEIWDDNIGSWIRIDATPTQKEDWENSNENWQEQNQNNDQNADNNFWDNQNQSWDSQQDNGWEKTKSDWDDSQSDKSDSSNADNNTDSDSQSNQENDSDNNSQSDSEQQSDNQQPSNDKWKLNKSHSDQPNKSPEELLDEMIEKAKEDSLLGQSEQLKDTLDKLKDARTKEEIKDILDDSGLSDFAKDMVDKVWEDKILEEEKKEIESLDDERKIDEALKDSLLNDEYKQKLKNYADIMKKKIQEEKKKTKSEMERLWFKEEELVYYKEYKQLEAEVEPEVRKQIRELQKILPAQYQIVRDESQNYRSWPKLDWSKLTEFAVTWDPLIFRRNREIRESNEINMFETIIIDTSWSMWSFSVQWSILRESIKAAIIRAKVLEHFKVDFSIVLFWDQINEVMSFGEKFSSKWKCNIPAKLMRAAHVSWGNSREPISYVYQNMLKQFRQHGWKSFWNISFIWDWDLYNGQKIPELKAMVDDLKRRWFWITAYYINNSRSNLIEYYFWTQENWWAVYAWNSKDLAKKIVEAHKTHLKKKISKYTK